MAQETSLTATSPGPSFPLPRRFPPIVCSPHNPPYEQLLVGVGVGAMAFGVVVWPCWCWSSVSLSYNSGAPAIHPTSSCSSAWRWVLCRPSFVAAVEGAVWGPGAVPRCCGALVLVPHCRRCPPSSTRPTQPASRCLQSWEWVVGRRCHVGGG
jgi:hypothetical protein